MDVGPIMPGAVPPTALPTGGVSPAAERSFSDVLSESIERVSRLQVEADATLDRLRLGEVSEAEALASLQQARVAMEAMAEIRDRIVSAFQEIQQMRV